MSDLARRPQSVADAHPVDWEAALRYLQLNPKDPRAQALVMVCDRYGLDPLLGHVSLYDGKPYVHFSAYLHIANSDSHFDGIECIREWNDDTYYWATVRVHRDDRNFPSERTGKSRKLKPKKGGGTYEDDTADAKAFAQAARRALRMAFNVDAPEPGEDGPEQPAPEPVVEVARMVDGRHMSERLQEYQPSGAGERRPGLNRDVRDDPAPGPTSDPPGFAPPATGGSDSTSGGATEEPRRAVSPTPPDPTPPDDAEAGDAIPDANGGEGPGEIGGQRLNEAVANAMTGPTPDNGGPSVDNTNTEPGSILRWASSHGLLHSRVLSHLRKEHPEHFGDLRSVQDLWAMGGESSQRAIAYLKAAFDEAGKPDA